MEAIMRMLSIKELMRLTGARPDRSGHPDHQRAAGMPEGSENRQIALMNPRNIRIVLARHDLTP
jgi:hypothetical protein